MADPHKAEWPDFSDPADERLHRKQRLAGAFRLFSKFGFDEGAAGHITARDPERTDCFWVNPFGVHFSQISVSDLLLVDHEGQLVEGEGSINLAAFVIHSQVHAARPDVISAAHSHSPRGRAWSTLGRTLDPLTQDACAFYEDHAVFDDYTGVVVDMEEGKRIAASLGGNKAAILRNHGLLTVGTSVDEAVWWYVAMERSCGVQLDAEATGSKPIVIDHEQALATRAMIGSGIAGWFSFQPLFSMIVREQPDLLD